jgi:hypothetical protein
MNITYVIPSDIYTQLHLFNEDDTSECEDV